MPAEAGLQLPHAAEDAARYFLSSFQVPCTLLVAVSGGSDSKGLLLALHRLISNGEFAGFRLVACTVDHGLRRESADEARAVHAFCALRGIPHMIMSWTGDKPATGLQDAARLARYRLLAQAARPTGAACIVTGHTQDDQRETIAMRAERSQPDAIGLSGMARGFLFERATWVYRPLLDVARADIRSLLIDLGEDWVEDASNDDHRFERARMRQALACAGKADGPAEAGFGTMHAGGRSQPAMAASSARAISSAAVAALLDGHVRVHHCLVAHVAPALSGATTPHDGLRAVLLVAAVIGGRAHPAGRDTAQRLSKFLDGEAYGRMTAGRVVFDRRRSGLYLYREMRDLPRGTVGAGETVPWDGRFTIENRSAGPLQIGPAGLFAATLQQAAAGLIDAGVPEAVSRRAAGASVCVSGATDAKQGNCADCLPPDVAIEAAIPLYDTFMPCFDRMIAQSLATHFGRQPYVSSPAATF